MCSSKDQNIVEAKMGLANYLTDRFLNDEYQLKCLNSLVGNVRGGKRCTALYLSIQPNVKLHNVLH